MVHTPIHLCFDPCRQFPGRCDAGYSGPSCEAFCPNACSGTLGQKGGEMVVFTRENVAFDETNRGTDRNSPTHTGVNQPKIGV